jgi:hypothetical protein
MVASRKIFFMKEIVICKKSGESAVCDACNKK